MDLYDGQTNTYKYMDTLLHILFYQTELSRACSPREEYLFFFFYKLLFTANMSQIVFNYDTGMYLSINKTLQ